MIAFDLDGTLFDCRPRQMELLEDILRRLNISGVELTTVWEDKRKGLTTRASLLRCGLTESDVEKVGKIWLEDIEKDEWLRLDKPFAWSKSALVELRRLSPMVLISARQRAQGVHDTLKRFALAGLFDEIHVVAVGTAVAEKAAYLRKCAATIWCGDSEVDAVAGAKANVPFYAATCGQRSAEFLRLQPHVALIEDVRDLPMLLNSANQK